jgi:MYXO-CTERM domain-containing protein
MCFCPFSIHYLIWMIIRGFGHNKSNHKGGIYVIKKVLALIFAFTFALTIIGSATYATDGNKNNDDTKVGAVNDNDDNDMDWGWIGLIGLAGLFGLRRRDDRDDRK